jgi:hypothetical protein
MIKDIIMREKGFVYLLDMARTDRVKIQSWHRNSLDERVFGWHEVTVVTALQLGEKRGRCVECDNPVKIFNTGKNGEAAHPEHYNRNPACSLSDVDDADRPPSYKPRTK